MGNLCPLLVHALQEKKIFALQFLHGGRVRVCSRNCATRLTGRNYCPIIFALPIPVTPADRPTSSVYLRYLPVEVSDESVRTASDAFGNVFLSVPQLLKNFQVSVMVPAFS